MSIWHNLFSDIGHTLNSILLAIIVDALHRIAQWRKKKRGHFSLREFAISAAEEVRVRQSIIEGRKRVNACDGYFLAVHNGGELASGKSALRVTRMYEEPDGDTLPQAEQFCGDMIASLPGLNDLILDPGPSFTPVAKLPVGKLRYLLECGKRQALALSVVTRGERTLGCVVFDFKTTEKPANLDAVMAQTVYQVEQILRQY